MKVGGEARIGSDSPERRRRKTVLDRGRHHTDDEDQDAAGAPGARGSRDGTVVGEVQGRQSSDKEVY